MNRDPGRLAVALWALAFELASIGLAWHWFGWRLALVLFLFGWAFGASESLRK